MLLRLIAVVLFLGWPLAASACDLCAVYAATRAQGLAPSAWTIGLATQFTHFGTLRLDGAEVPNDDDQRIDSTITQLVLARGFGDRLGVQLSVPFIDRSYQRPQDGTIEHGRVRGLGDAVLLARYELVQRDRLNSTVHWDVMGGLKFPTGPSDRLAEELNEPGGDRSPMSDRAALPSSEVSPSGVHGHDLALGSGSVDVVLGSNAYVRWHRALATALIQWSQRQRGDFHYRYANDLTWEAAPGFYVLLGHPHTLALQCVVAGERKAQDDLAGAPAEDTGLSSIYVGPRIMYTHGERLAASLGAEFPRRMHTTALQLTADYRVRGNVSWSF